MVVGTFLPLGGSFASDKDKEKSKPKDTGTYAIDMVVDIHNKDELKKKFKDGGIIKASHRQVKVYKLKDTKDFTEDKILDLARIYYELDIRGADRKLKRNKLLDKPGFLSEKSKLIYKGKAYDEIDLYKMKDFKFEDLEREQILIPNLIEGYYLIKETDESEEIEDEGFSTFVVKLPDKDMKDNKKVIVAKPVKEVPKKPLKLIKIDAENKDIRINKTQFALYKKGKDGKDELVKVTGEKGKYFYDDKKGSAIALETWDKGELTVENLPDGMYYFKETKPAENYDFDGNANVKQESKTVGPDGEVTVTNNRPPAIMKVDSKTGEPLYNAKFKLFTKDGKHVKFTLKDGKYVYDPKGDKDLVASSKQGSIYVKDLPNGTYYFMEIEPPNGYYIKDIDKKYSFDYKDGKMTVHDGGYYLSIGNPKIHTGDKPNPPGDTPKPPGDTPKPPDEKTKKPKGGISFVKIDNSNDEKRLGGAKFILLKKEGNDYTNVLNDGKEVYLTSKDNGEFSIDGLEYGEYALKEIEAPKDHIITNPLTTFTIDAASMLLPQTKIVNEPYTPKTTVKKTKTNTNTNTSTITTKYVPSDITRIVRTPLVKTGDIRIVIMAVAGFILLLMGIKLVRAGEKLQRI